VGDPRPVPAEPEEAEPGGEHHQRRRRCGSITACIIDLCGAAIESDDGPLPISSLGPSADEKYAFYTPCRSKKRSVDFE
jgi:hypothetical protein